MPRPPPFDILKWSFLLLASLLAVQIMETLLGVLACIYMVVAGRSVIGACVEAGIVSQIREIFSESLTAVLALLLAARNRPP
jgi:hypothetical protein